MITFVLAAAVLVGALCVAVALDDTTTEAPPGVVAHVLAARLLTTDQTVPVAWGVRLNTDRERTRCQEAVGARIDRPLCFPPSICVSADPGGDRHAENCHPIEHIASDFSSVDSVAWI
jgi:hypothetical protein